MERILKLATPLAQVYPIKIGIVIPCYKASETIQQVVTNFAPFATKIYIVDDACPDKSSQKISLKNISIPLEILQNEKNLGVGGATLRGMLRACEEGMDIIVKVDADNQMDPFYFSDLIAPLLNGTAHYTKGNRFFHIDGTTSMPKLRLLGNAALSFFVKLMSGYWNLTDPTNGYIAIKRNLLKQLEWSKIDSRYFFEMDMIFRIALEQATIAEISMPARYLGEQSSLKVSQVLFEFPPKILQRILKRIFYNYFLREFNPGTISLLASFFLLLFGGLFGGYHWMASTLTGKFASSGTVMVAALSILLGFQSFLYFLQYDTLKGSPQSFVSPKQLR